MGRNGKRFLALFLTVVLCLGVLEGAAAAEGSYGETIVQTETGGTSPAGGLSAEAVGETAGADGLAKLLAETISGRQMETAGDAAGANGITGLEVAGTQAVVNCHTDCAAELVVAVYEEDTQRMAGSGMTYVNAGGG